MTVQYKVNESHVAVLYSTFRLYCINIIVINTRDSEQTLIISSPFFIHRGLIAEKPDDSLFFVDTGEKDKDTQPRKYIKSSLCILCHSFSCSIHNCFSC